jgi:hypothetical protein
MAAGTLDLSIEQGSTYNLVLTWKVNGTAVNLTNYTARLQARVDVEDTETVLSMTTGAGITLGGALGTITLDQSAAQTAAIAAGTYIYDLEMVAGSGTVTRLVQGELVVSAEVTR